MTNDPLDTPASASQNCGADHRKNRFPRAFWAWAVTLLLLSCILEYVVRSRDWFRYYPWIDNPMHFFWGANVFWICLVVFRCRPKWAIFLVFVWQVIWETGEIIGDKLIEQPAYMIDGIWPDGVKDTLMDLAGALALWAVFHSASLFAAARTKPTPTEFRADP